MALNLNPHEFAVDPNTLQPVMTRVQSYIRLREGTDPPMFLQAGKVYSEGGQLIPREKWPGWLQDAILQMTPPALEECGFTAFVQALNVPAEKGKK